MVYGGTIRAGCTKNFPQVMRFSIVIVLSSLLSINLDLIVIYMHRFLVGHRVSLPVVRREDVRPHH